MLIDKESINFRDLERLILKISANELSRLNEPCYYPSLKIGFYELLDKVRLTETDVKRYTKTYWEGMPEKNWKLHNDPISIFMIELMGTFLDAKREIGYNSLILLYMIRIYTNLMNKQIKFCNKDVFKYTLEHMNKTHLFVREGSIPNAIYFMTKILAKKYRNDILNNNKKGISKFITESRHRISQSVKSFAETYYKFHKEGKQFGELKDTYEVDEEGSVIQTGTPETAKETIFIDKILIDIIAYKSVEDRILSEAKRLAGITDEWVLIFKENMFDVDTREYLRRIMFVFLKKLTSIRELCSRQYYDIIKQLMFIKKSTELVYFKKEVIEFTNYIIKKAKKESEFLRLSKANRYRIYYFVAYVVTLILRKKMCR